MLFKTTKIETREAWESRMREWTTKFAWRHVPVAREDGKITFVLFGFYERRAVEFAYDPGTGFFVSRYEHRLPGSVVVHQDLECFGETW